MKLLVACRAIDRMAGGVERMAARLMAAMAERGHAVDLLTWDRNGAQSFYPLHPEIDWHRLNIGDPARRASVGDILRRAESIRHLVRDRDVDVIVAFQSGPFIALRTYAAGLGIPVIASERNAPTILDHTRAGRWRTLIFQGLRLADRITIQCESYRSLYPAYLRDRITTIPNPVFPARRRADPAAPAGGRFRLLSVGRFGYQKNYAVLVDAFAAIARDVPDWDLDIYGEGEDRGAIERRIAAHGLGDRILLKGVTKDIESVYSGAHAVVLSSRWEGFPNVIAEGMAHGLPAVGFGDTAGVRDLVHHERTGLLAPGNGNAESLSRTLRRIMSNDRERAEMGRRAAESVRQFAPDKVFDTWEQMLLSVGRDN